MKFFGETHLDFVSKRRVAFIVSIVIILAGFITWIARGGLIYSIDFTGGTSLELDLAPNSPDIDPLSAQDLRNVLTKAGYEDIEIQNIGKRTHYLIRTKAGNTQTQKNQNQISENIISILKSNFPDHTDKATEELIRLQSSVGPRIGQELKGKAVWAIFYSLLGIIIYIWWRFEFTFGLAAVIALFHDVLITLGIFAMTGKEISLPIVAALLTIVGYSLNDTIVVFDRIREDLKVYRREGYESIVNHSINETLSRTVITSLTTFVVVLTLYLFGGTVINDFAFALMIGVVVGTYSSIFIASPILVEHFIRRQNRKGIRRGR